MSRCCTAFGVDSVCLVGSRHINTFGSHGADAHVRMRHFPTLEECSRVLKDEDGCRTVGVEIVDGAKAVHSDPFEGPTAFMLGNEGQVRILRLHLRLSAIGFAQDLVAGSTRTYRATIRLSLFCRLLDGHTCATCGYDFFTLQSSGSIGIGSATIF